MATQHTAGPWVYDVASGEILSADRDAVATTTDNPFTEAEQDANGRLIAEAPAMLAIVRQLHQGDTTPEAIDRLLSDCRAILARIDCATSASESKGETCQHCGEDRPLGPPSSVWQCGACNGLNPSGQA